MIAGGVDWDAVGKAMRAWVVAGTGLSIDKCIWTQQQGWRPAAPAVMLRCANIAENGKPWTTTQENPYTFTTKTVTAVSAAANTFTIPAHGIPNGTGPVELHTSGTEPGGTDVDDPYWLYVVDPNTIKLATSFQNAMNGQPSAPAPVTVDITDAGTGVHTIVANGDTRQAGAELLEVVRGTLRVTLELKCHAVDGVGPDMAVAILQRIRSNRMFESMKAILRAQQLAILDVDRVRALLGTVDAALFEPKALLEVHFNVPLETGEAVTYIEIVEIIRTLNLGAVQVVDTTLIS